jgi:nucleotide-binding universal stress UspA family protein
MFTRILVPQDGSELAKQAVGPAVEIAKRFDATIVLARAVHVSFGAMGDAYMATPDLYNDLYTQAQSEAQANLQAVAAEIQAAGVKVEAVILEGEPAGALVDLEASGQIDLVVMSTHGRSGLARFVYGSTAEQLLRHGTKPVMLIRAQDHPHR